MPNRVKKVLHYLGPFLILGIFLGAIWLLYRQISQYSIADIKASLAQISTFSLLLSVLLMVINYAILVGYDWLALKGIHKTLPLPRVTLVSFVGQAVSYNFGALLGGSTVRYRFYSAWGFSPMDIVRLVLMLAITFWVGALGLVGGIFMIAPPDIPQELSAHLPSEDIRPLGILLFLIAMSYLVVCRFVHKPIHILGREFAFPPFKIAVAQALVAGADLVAAGACLYVLLPPDADVSFIQFLPSYLLAMVLVVVTHVPGGVGVLEVVILHLTTAAPQGVFAALLCFRVIYYLIPLLIAAVLFAIYEFRYQTRQNSGALHQAGRWMRAFSPTIMAYALFAAGTILCFSVMMPVSDEHLETLSRLVPLSVMEAAYIVAALSGAALLFLAPGLQQRQAAAYKLSLAMLAGGCTGILLGSMNWPAALFTLIMLFCVLSIRRRCCRPSSLWKVRIRGEWISAALVVLACAAGLGLIILRSDPADPDAWFATGYAADSPRLMRALAAECLLVVALFIGYARTAPLRRRRKKRAELSAAPPQ